MLAKNFGPVHNIQNVNVFKKSKIHQAHNIQFNPTPARLNFIPQSVRGKCYTLRKEKNSITRTSSGEWRGLTARYIKKILWNIKPQNCSGRPQPQKIK